MQTQFFRSETVQWACRLNFDIKPILIQSSGLFNISKTLLFIPAISSRFSFQSSTDVSKLSKHASMRGFNDPCLGWNESFGGKYVRWNLVMNWGHIIIFKLDFFLLRHWGRPYPSCLIERDVRGIFMKTSRTHTKNDACQDDNVTNHSNDSQGQNFVTNCIATRLHFVN